MPLNEEECDRANDYAQKIVHVFGNENPRIVAEALIQATGAFLVTIASNREEVALRGAESFHADTKAYIRELCSALREKEASNG